MTDPGLRERKKARTRQVIADAAARLFAQRGYEQVAVSDVAREAEVSEQTVYNYFQTKEQLVTDRDQLVQDELSRLIRTRAPGTTPAAAIREFVLDTVEGIRRIPAEQWRGELGFLAAISPTVHRLALEMSDRQATALATALAETDTVAPEIARLRGIALAGVFQIIIAEAGRRTREGQSQNQIADELRPAIEAVLDDLDAWLSATTDQDNRNRATEAEGSAPPISPGPAKSSPKANHREKLPGQAARDRGTPAFRTGEFRPRRQRPGPASGRGGCVPQPSRPRCTGSWRPLPAVRPLPGPVSWDCWKGRLVPRPRALTRSRSG